MQEFGIICMFVFITVFSASLGYFKAKSNIVEQCEASGFYSLNQTEGLICSKGELVVK